MAALDRMETNPGNHVNEINSWKEAKIHLGDSMAFESDDHAEMDEQDRRAALDPRDVNTFNLNQPRDSADLITAITESSTSSYTRERALLQKFRNLALASTSHKITAHAEEGSVLGKELGGTDDQGMFDILDAADCQFMMRLKKAEKETALKREHPAIRQSREKLEAKERAQAEETVEREKEEQRIQEARQRASSLMRELTPDEQAMVRSALDSIGPENEIMAQAGADTVQRASIQRLRPGQWLNDEVIHFFLTVLSKRDEEMCAKDKSRKRTHFFKSFFMSKLLNEGHSNPDMNGSYEYRNVKRWSKKVPGKDIFNLNKICFPINQGGMHWVCAVAYMQEKRIQFYDSMGSQGEEYLEAIFKFIQDEHLDKKETPLPEENSWRLVTCEETTPRQLNGHDCGVFTCMFIDFLSKDCPVDCLRQGHISQCRDRIALSILKGTAIM